MELLAKTFEGLEQILADEIEAIGGTNIRKVTRAVLYEGDDTVLYKSNMLLRTALRVLVIKKEFKIRNQGDLYNTLSRVPWEGLMELHETFAVDCVCFSKIFTHSKYPALLAKDAIVDRFRKLTGKRPNVNPVNPHFIINIHIREDIVTLSLDSTGESLHKRGYRIAAVDAPLNEVMAAGLVLLSGWKGETPLLDPMCGSGTIVCEAARIAYDIPPQSKDRTYGFMKWKSYKKEIYEDILNTYYTDLPENKHVEIIGSDKSLRAMKISQQNTLEAGLDHLITIEKRDFFKNIHEGKFTIITNPPYDERLKITDVNKFYKNIGDVFKTYYSGSTAFVFSGNIDALKCVGLKPNRKIPLKNGSIDSRMYRYDLYAGYGDEA